MLNGHDKDRLRLTLAGLIAGCGVAGLVGIIALAHAGRDVPPVLTGITGTCIGALVTYFARLTPGE